MSRRRFISGVTAGGIGLAVGAPLSDKAAAPLAGLVTRGRSFRTEHFDGQRFFNPTGANGQPLWRVPRMLLARWAPWPAHLPVQPGRPPAPQDPEDVVVTFIGHATFLIQTRDGSILTDPIYAERASPVTFLGPRRVRPPGVAFSDLPSISVVLLFAGDTGYAPHFHEVREDFGSVDLALLPIGAYEPRWFMPDVHMHPTEAVQAHLDLQGRQSIGMHFGTFQLTPEAIRDPVTALEEALRARHIPTTRFRTLDVGESLRLESSQRQRESERPVV